MISSTQLLHCMSYLLIVICCNCRYPRYKCTRSTFGASSLSDLVRPIFTFPSKMHRKPSINSLPPPFTFTFTWQERETTCHEWGEKEVAHWNQRIQLAWNKHYRLTSVFVRIRRVICNRIVEITDVADLHMIKVKMQLLQITGSPQITVLCEEGQKQKRTEQT